MPDPVWLDSGKPRSLQSRFDIISAAPLQVLETRAGITRSSGPNIRSSESRENPFLLAQRLLDDMARQFVSKPADQPEHAPRLPFTGGLIGSFGYQLGNHALAIEGSGSGSCPDTNPASNHVVDFPDMRLGFYAWALIVNHQTRQAWLVFHPACPADLKRDIHALLDTRSTTHSNTSSHPSPGFHLTEHFQSSTSKSTYLDTVKRIKRYIRSGDCYQVNYAQHFSATYQGDPWLAYQDLRQVLPSPFSAYLEWDDKAILSLSPERFLKVANGRVETKPIKGTIPRGQTVKEDEEAAITLLNSSKDRAENLMIVDLLRNDLGKACRPGSIHVPKLFGLESFANVHHLVSTVTGQLREEESSLSLLEHCFPGGSITGAPKKRAMEIIAELEAQNRALYCGSIAYISTNGRMDSNIVIRSLLADGNRLHCWGGGGIVADSDPETEYQESITKVDILLKALKQADS